MIKIAVSGACGKMGQRIINLINEDKALQLVCALEHKDHKMIGQNINGVKISSNPEEIKNSRVLIEFTNPEVTISHLEYVLKYKRPVVIGATGLDDAQIKKIKSAASKIAIVFSPNMSIGVNLLFELVKIASSKLGNSYCVKIVEAHHVHKKDSPSGTAKRIEQILQEERCKVEDIQSIREGETIGDHRVIFQGAYDRLEIFHSAKSRDIFAKGALEAAKWVINKNAGLYTMMDVLKG